MEGIMEQPRMLPCPACGEEFTTPQQLQIHRREAHPQSEKPTALLLDEAQTRDDNDREVF
jgi:hypothetical protein